MRTALLHYWLTNVRGGEKVLAALAAMLPDADIFTHAYNPALAPLFGAHRVRETFIARLPFARRHPQAYLPLMPTASRALDLGEYDLIISSESGPIKGVNKPSGARHICYCHTPMRYLWDMADQYYRSASLAGKAAMRLFAPYLRREDLRSAEGVDQFIANSAFVAQRIRRIYGREAKVIHPPVDVGFFSAAASDKMRDHYLLAGALVAYKRPELALRACRRMNRRLVVVGEGKMRAALEREARGWDGVTFLGRTTDAQLRDAYANARALIFPGIEDFGIVPVEAQAAGTPVIARGEGGALETVKRGETGLFFGEATVDSLCGAIEEFESRKWEPGKCREWARTFAPERFRKAMECVTSA